METIFYQETDFELIDTLSPFVVFERPIILAGRYPAYWSIGYAFRESVVENDRALPLIGADMHAYKTGLSWGFDFLQYRINLDGQLIYGYLDRSKLYGGRYVDGDMLSISASVRINF